MKPTTRIAWDQHTRRYWCPCGRSFTTKQGLGLHWRWMRKKGELDHATKAFESARAKR